MNPAHLIPTPDPLQIPWGWFQLLLSVTFFLHLIVMNLLLGWSIIAFCRHVFCTEFPQDNQFLAHKIPFTVAFTVNFGVAPLLFLQVLYGHFIYTSSVLMASYWLSIIGLLILIYYAAYIYNLQFSRLTGLHTIISGFIMTLLLIITFFFTNNMSLMVNPQHWVAYFDSPNGLQLNFADHSLIPRYLHSVFASVAVGGLALGLYHDFQLRRGDISAKGRIASAMNWFTFATCANFAVGAWYFGSLPTTLRTVSSTSSALLLTCILAGAGASIPAMIYAAQRRVRPAAFTILGAILAMTLAREFLRRLTLAPWFDTSELAVAPQYSPFLLFLVIFVAGLYLVWRMIKLVLPPELPTENTVKKEARS